MKTLRLGTLLMLSGGLLLAGCGEGGRNGEGDDDGGVRLMDGETPDTGNGGGDDGGNGGGDSGNGGGRGSMCADTPCNLVTNEGCEAGQACAFGPEGPTCVEAGLGGDGDTCMGPTDCQEGFACIMSGSSPDGGVPSGTCEPFCCESDDDCPAGQLCIVNVNDGEFQVCDQPDECSLLEQTGCDPGQGCYPIDNDGSRGCAAPTTDSSMQGDDCMSLNGCAPGFMCLVDRGCATICDTTGGGPGCPDGTMCQRYSENFAPEVGVCISGG